MRLQYQMSNGSWVNCNGTLNNFGGSKSDRTAEFMARCVQHGGVGDEAAVIAMLATGKSVRNYSSDWYSNCRDGEIAEDKAAALAAQRAAAEAADTRPTLRCKSCGQTGRRGSYPFSTNPSSGRCDDCC
jgi:hypothetical protein